MYRFVWWVREREGLIKPAGKYRRTTFIFSVLIIQLGTVCVRSFVSAAFANRCASRNARIRSQWEIAEASKRNIPVKSGIHD